MDAVYLSQCCIIAIIIIACLVWCTEQKLTLTADMLKDEDKFLVIRWAWAIS